MFKKNYLFIYYLYLFIAQGGLNVDTNPLKQFIEKTFPGSIIKDEHQGYLHYQLRDTDRTWANLFGIMEKAKYIIYLDKNHVHNDTS